MVKLIFINFIQLEGKEMVGGLLRVDIEKLRKWGVYYRSVEGQMLSPCRVCGKRRSTGTKHGHQFLENI